MTLTARDEAGNEGSSAPTEIKLPGRIFTKPLARALIEQRRILALDADAKPRIMAALDALSIAPEKFTKEVPHYLGLRSIYWQLNYAKTDDQLRDVVARLWGMAVTIEDGMALRCRSRVAAGAGSLAAGAGARRDRRGDQEAHRRAARGARQVHAGARRADAQESRAARAPARPQHPHAAAARLEEHDRPARAAGAFGRQGRGEEAARRAAADAGKPADGPARPAGRRRHG